MWAREEILASVGDAAHVVRSLGPAGGVAGSSKTLPTQQWHTDALPRSVSATPPHSGTAPGTPGWGDCLLDLNPIGEVERESAFLRDVPVIRWAVGIIFLATLGCVSDQAFRYYAHERFDARPVEEVELLRDAPQRPYDVIADFQARGASPSYMRKKAAEIGADAVIVGIYGGYRAKSDQWASEDQHSDTYTRITGTAIRYKR